MAFWGGFGGRHGFWRCHLPGARRQRDMGVAYRSTIGSETSVHTSQSLPGWRMHTHCTRSRSRRSVFAGRRPRVRKSSRHFYMARTRINQNTRPRIARRSNGRSAASVSPPWFARTGSRPEAGHGIAGPPANGGIFAFVRKTRIPSKRASCASLPASISKTGLSFISRLLRRSRR
jgi:hypothetical protein